MPILTRLKASKNNKELTREQALEREINLLKIEVEYLKKLQSLDLEIPHRLIK